MSDLNESRTRWHAIEKLTSAANRLTSSKPTEPEPDGKNFNGVSGSTQATTDQDLEQRIKDPSHPVPVKGLGQTDELVDSRKHELVIGLLMSYLADLAINRKSPPMGLLQGNPPKLTYSVLAEELAPYTDKRIDQTFGASIQHGLSKTTLRKALGRAAQRFSDEHLRE